MIVQQIFIPQLKGLSHENVSIEYLFSMAMDASLKILTLLKGHFTIFNKKVESKLAEKDYVVWIIINRYILHKFLSM